MQAAGPLERSGELETLESVVAGAVEGTGGVVVVEGPPGIGKSRLLRAAAESAEFLGARSLRARATELERSYPFGVALQLFEPPVAAAG
ncbi:MAG TPA: AAA family ATPase, partial [Solirubrobacteraceae bacterium]|nr:AAA family ATPase [Solirubrobacteraceae bacterium]